MISRNQCLLFRVVGKFLAIRQHRLQSTTPHSTANRTAASNPAMQMVSKVPSVE
jgi:hypothetical protein